MLRTQLQKNWKDVIWALTTRMDPVRDTVTMENTPIDYLDFASPVAGLGSKIGFDATNKWPQKRPRQTHHDGGVVFSAAVYVHEVGHCC